MYENEDNYDIAYADSKDYCTKAPFEGRKSDVVSSNASANDSTAVKTVQNPYYGGEMESESHFFNSNATPTGAYYNENIVITRNPYYE